MGRKPAPQPLALSEAALPASDRRLPETLKIVSAEDPFTSTSRSTTASPPISPFRFADKNGQAQTQTQTQTQTSRPAQPQSQPPPPPVQAQAQAQKFQQPVHVADLVQQPLEDVDSPGYPPSANTISSVTYSYGQPQQQQQQQQQPQTYQKQQYNQQTYQQQQYQPAQQHEQLQQKQHGHGRHRQNEDKASKSNFFFHFGKSSTAAKSSEKLASNSTTPTNPNTQFANPRDRSASRGFDSPAAKHNFKPPDSSYVDHNAQQKAAASNGAVLPTRSEASFGSSTPQADPSSTPLGKKGKQKTFARLGRSRSIRDDNGNPHPLNSNTSNNIAYSATSPGLQASAPMRVVEQPERVHQPVPSLKTAPIIQHDRPFRDMMPSSTRNHSADRVLARDVPSTRDGHHRDGHFRDGHRGDRDRDHLRTQPSSLRDNGSGYTFFNGLKNSSRSAADIISKGLFGKNTRSASTTEREPVVDDEHYVLKLINQPLVEQTRLTRISKRLEDSRDRTEFWMPAFPWRAIDYLNYKGTDVEGLYRVPGSGPQIKKWQRKFDEEYDVDLFAQDDLYDINIIGSMLKAWLRELPDELFPKAAQERIARECAGAETVPQMLIDELSNLSPFNYYLLFAITCHLSLLLAHSDKNKMDFRNLCICFQPCMKIDAFSFKFLVCDWRDCWKGCLNEPQFIEQEYQLFDMPPPNGIGTLHPQHQEANEAVKVERPPPAAASVPATVVVVDDRNVSSSDSSKQSNHSTDGKARLRTKPATVETGSVASNETLSTTLTIESLRVTTPPRQSGDLRPLSPIKPLSPMGF